MSGLYFVVDLDRCWGCKACQVACKQEHVIPPGEGNVRIIRVENEQSGKLHCDFVPVFCQHCTSPDCMKVCPCGAIRRDEENLVQIDPSLCVSCGACADACSFGAIHLRSGDGGVAEKCDLCVERRSRGFPCSCEQHCLGHVFTSCDEERKNELVENRYVFTVGRVVYVSSKLAGLGKSL